MNRHARVCAVTINYRNADDTVKCVASLLRSSVANDVVVVDNSPNDPMLAALLPASDRVVLVTPCKNLGFGAGNNEGVRVGLSDGEYDYVFLLNSDATVSPGALERLIDAADRLPRSGIFCPKIVLQEDPERLWYGGGEVDWRRSAARAPGMLGSARAVLACTSRQVTFATGCAMLIRGSVWNELGGFDERFFMYEEDLELTLRAGENGWESWYEASAVVSHVGQGSTRVRGKAFVTRLSPRNANVAFFAYHSLRNRILNARLHAHGFTRAVACVGLVALVVEKGLLYVWYRRWAGVAGLLHGVADGLRA